MGAGKSKSMEATKSNSRLSISKSTLDLPGSSPSSGNEALLVPLGRGEAGKSTIGKQMRLVYGPEQQRNGEAVFTLAERRLYRRVIHANAIQSLTELLHAMMRTKISFVNAPRAEDSKNFFMVTQSPDSTGIIDSELAEVMARLWKDAGTQNCFAAQIKDSRLNDSASYFLDALERISKPDYLPLREDIIRARLKKTRENVETLFEHEGISFRMIEFGSGDRRNMTSCLKTMDAMLFCVALSEYNGFTDGDGTEGQLENLLQSSLRLFKTIVQAEWFRAPIFLVLTKKDLFREKLKETPLTASFPQYTGANTFEDCVAYIRQKFESLVPRQGEVLIRTVIVNALDTADVLIQFRPVAAALLAKKRSEAQVINAIAGHKQQPLKKAKKGKESRNATDR